MFKEKNKNDNGKQNTKDFHSEMWAEAVISNYWKLTKQLDLRLCLII